nr:MAG TPA: hypothetical protein [Crassvirales sp.]
MFGILEIMIYLCKAKSEIVLLLLNNLILIIKFLKS